MASKKESTFGNMVLSLFIVTLISSAVLGLVYEYTKAPIEQSQLKSKLEAIKKVVPEYDNNPNAEMFTVDVDGSKLEVYPAKKGGNLVGLAVKTFTNKGFSGEIKVMVGFTTDGTVYNYQVLEHKETPGLGSKMDEWFRPAKVEAGGEHQKASFVDWLFGIKPGGGGDGNSIINKNPKDVNFTVTKDGGDIDAITAATISSRAFLDAVNRGYKAWQEAIKQSTVVTATVTPKDEEGGK